MKIAYLILAHEQPRMFKRLVKALDSKDIALFTHIDKKALQQEFFVETQFCRLLFLDKRVAVNHSGFTQVEAMLRLIERAISYRKHDYYVFLTGRDYPVKSNDYIQRFLEENNGTNYISFYKLAGDVDYVNNIRYYYFVDELSKAPRIFLKPLKTLIHIFNRYTPNRSFIKGMIPYRGSTSWFLTEETVKYVLGFVRSPKNKIYKQFFKRVSCSDEIFFQTIVLNSPYAPKCKFFVRDVLKAGKVMRNMNMAYLHFIDWNPKRESPSVLDIRDYENIKKSGALFARKLDEERSLELIERLG